MRTEVKAALVGTMGVTLLLGGAGTLAYWTESGTTGGATVNSGELGLSSPDCHPDPALTSSVWTINGTAEFDPTSQEIVPGDTVVKVCTFTITATGQNLSANLTTTGGADSGDLAPAVTTTSSFLVDGQSVTTITDADTGATLTARIEVAFPFGTTADNSSENDPAVVSDYVVTLTQADPAP